MDIFILLIYYLFVLVSDSTSWSHCLLGVWNLIHCPGHFWGVDNVLLPVLLQEMWWTDEAVTEESKVAMANWSFRGINALYNHDFVSTAKFLLIA